MRYLMFGLAVLLAIVVISAVVGFVHFDPVAKAKAAGEQARAAVMPVRAA